jgi:hypothetical protein
MRGGVFAGCCNRSLTGSQEKVDEMAAAFKQRALYMADALTA